MPSLLLLGFAPKAFRTLNYTACVKILKKHDKVAKVREEQKEAVEGAMRCMDPDDENWTYQTVRHSRTQCVQIPWLKMYICIYMILFFMISSRRDCITNKLSN